MYMPYLLMGSCFYDISVSSQQYAVVVHLLDETEYADLTAMAHTQWRGNPTYAQIQGARSVAATALHLWCVHRFAWGPIVLPQQPV